MPRRSAFFDHTSRGSPLIRQSYDRYDIYIPDVVVCVKWEIMVRPDVGKENAVLFWQTSAEKREERRFIPVDGIMPGGVQ